jgi:hypothetical protein
MGNHKFRRIPAGYEDEGGHWIADATTISEEYGPQGWEATSGEPLGVATFSIGFIASATSRGRSQERASAWPAQDRSWKNTAASQYRTTKAVDPRSPLVASILQ